MVILLSVIEAETPLIYIKKSSGPSTDPWDTEETTAPPLEHLLVQLTVFCQLGSY